MSFKFKFCPMCARALETIVSEFEHMERIGCKSCGFIDYNNSRPTASALLINDADEVLLVTRSWHPFKGFLDVPGGFLESGEHPYDGLKREIREELNLDIVVPQDAFVIECDTYDDGDESVQFASKGAPTLNIFFIIYIDKDAPCVNDKELAGMEWYSIKNLPQLLDKIAFDSNRKALLKLHSVMSRK